MRVNPDLHPTVYAWIADRRISHVRLGRTVRILPSEIARVLEAGTVPARQECFVAPQKG